jgi:glutamate N-acetyltransferase/amino-acid N-acetyltransferase
VVFDPAKADLFLGDVQVVRNGVGVEEDWEARAHKALSQREFLVTLDLHLGQSTAEILTTDFSAEYVRINADYRS